MGGNAIVVFELDNIAGPVTNIMNLFQHGTMRRIAGNPLLVPLLALVSSKIASPRCFTVYNVLDKTWKLGD